MRHLFLLALLVACAPAYAGWPNQPDPYVCTLTKADARGLGIGAVIWSWLVGGCGSDHIHSGTVVGSINL
jgi:hypothetical protein